MASAADDDISRELCRDSFLESFVVLVIGLLAKLVAVKARQDTSKIAEQTTATEYFILGLNSTLGSSQLGM